MAIDEHTGFETPGIQPVVPEMTPSSGYRPEIGDPVLDRLREEDDGGSCVVPSAPDIDEVIKRRRQSAPSSGALDADTLRYIGDTERKLSEAKQSIAHVEALMAAFDGQSFLGRFFHYREFVKLRNQLDAAIAEERSLEELLRIASVGAAGGKE